MLPGKKRLTWSQLKIEVEDCKRCDLYKNATQSVFGSGNRKAAILIIGEQPGDREDLAGEAFVGPAGGVLKSCLQEAGIEITEVFMTNAVKHFKYVARGKSRIHQKPNAVQIQACKPWLDEQIRLLKPQVIMALGATAARSLLGKNIVISQVRGKVFPQSLYEARCFVSWHPSVILRTPDRQAAAIKRTELIADLKKAKSSLK
ncbi:UdgX family uracil-DNA binding protein [Bdellovibrio sp. HCB2-146]|uniref:UdgX family uracil-DNA binding protein n=1 Tax=Bdellovibrio sp. HCB2-146 TaxID=3394362 RepID=UPI0039BD5940